ncbi:MAG: hypothetical protein K5696_03015 [Lachnospiraceae bacterium]|nr:hypothetical protein [Lachnospiraceae bacterium]
MKTYSNAGMGLKAARIAAVTVMVIYFGIMAFGWITGATLPDAAIRFLGAVDLIAIPAAVFASIRLRMIRGQRREQ